MRASTRVVRRARSEAFCGPPATARTAPGAPICLRSRAKPIACARWGPRRFPSPACWTMISASRLSQQTLLSASQLLRPLNPLNPNQCMSMRALGIPGALSAPLTRPSTTQATAQKKKKKAITPDEVKRTSRPCIRVAVAYAEQHQQSQCSITATIAGKT